MNASFEALRWKESVDQGGKAATRLVSGIIPLFVIEEWDYCGGAT
ncbi:MAG TPA: hypothetical protein VND66_10880 [Acidobacteriaceae bacterium]|nr:hypothetical protein [Acidobacteriaceae bacterium]